MLKQRHTASGHRNTRCFLPQATEAQNPKNKTENRHTETQKPQHQTPQLLRTAVILTHAFRQGKRLRGMRGIGSYSEIKRKLALQRKKARENRQESAKRAATEERSKQQQTNKEKHAMKNSNKAKQKTRKKTHATNPN
jgi:hypothetical protein